MDKRIRSIDIVRGLVMIIMALDHTRDLLFIDSLTQNPADLATATPAVFFSRWITNLCAPTFVFLSGTSVYLSFKRDQQIGGTRLFLFKRGIWLILLEFTLINFALWFDTGFRLEMLQVIAAIGAGLILLSLLLAVNPRIVGIIGLVIVFSHNLLDQVNSPTAAGSNFLFSLFFRPGLHQLTPHLSFFVAYPILPWIGIMLLGFSIGPLFRENSEQRNKMLWGAGLASLALFVVIRLINGYGDPFPWVNAKNELYTFLSFINVTKYPPSLSFDLLFLGLMFIALRYSESWSAGIQRVLSVYGKVPLFYYLLHLYLIRIAVIIMIYAQGFHWKDLLFGPFQFGRPATGSGLSLGLVIVVWLVIVAALYPVCKWYGNYKMNHPEKKWLRYL